MWAVHFYGRVIDSGMWRSLVAHPLWERGAGGSNPSIPTNARIGYDFGHFSSPDDCSTMNDSVALLTEIRKREPTCGSTKIIGIDGRSGVGKTDFATDLAIKLKCDVVSLEWVYPGWHGLAVGIETMHAALRLLAKDEPVELAQWDWLSGSHGSPITLAPREVLILEGVGAGAALLRPFLSYLVWLDAPTEVRHERAIRRDGVSYENWWDIWAAQEEQYLENDRPIEHADLFVPTAHAHD